MTSNDKKGKNSYKKKAYSIGIVLLVTIILILGIKSTYAYYHKTDSFGILSGLVGNFNNIDGDINVIIYKENNNGEYSMIYNIPELGYIFDDSKTTCTIPCSNTGNPDADQNTSCHYTYNSSETSHEKAFSLTSNEKVSCSFYFNKETEEDIKVYIMKQDEEGTNSYTGKDSITRKYNIVEEVPAYGYKYSEYQCTNDIVNFEYNAELRKFNVATRFKNVCYAYFNSTGDADTTVKVYVQSAPSSTVYSEVTSIPENKKYELSTGKQSYCTPSEGSDNVTISYTDGYINISDINHKQTCHVYLDVVN